MVEPEPLTWTLRLKSHKTTVLLHVDPLSTFESIKTYLYNALQETGLNHPDTEEPIPLPPSASDIQFGRPVNINDASEGFQLGLWEYTNAEEEEEDVGKGKGKAKAKAVPVVKQCPKGAGLRDGSVLAFRWAGDGSWDGEEEFSTAKGDMWGVQLARFEDAWGEENETDVGGEREFEG
ncbi:Kinesin 6 [Pyrenophora seminiperda CCB06]|uniref:Kinesin 6 n=1 Tax=Pyrenophora seminiperda CCB06 TaxID=1302712 RepID=A0A3M7M1S8_9PLEO|nr:Kinesin 6 [Pyrenophora seminiperda CCB06]